ncbi:MAG: hypothetical protein COV47_01830 [Candidatus Diapherotrites archaeon CG11_big_fil_rev_8_21_14_0_20_37_9]|nr:MAG: hypothetical protein COV47_01830 [Candidatus Diapherotrites archaeon CG11_big_fil_rev_8_21_14_0_20_37_9]
MLFDPLIIAFIVAFIGFIFQKKFGFDQKSLANILIYITGPALTFAAIYSKEIILHEFFVIGVSAFAVMFASGIFAYLLYRVLGYTGTGMILPAMFMNSAYLGFPVALFAFGEEGLQYAIIYDLFETLLMFSLGVFLVQSALKKKREKLAGILKLPLIYAISFAIIFNFAQIQIPSVLVESLNLLGLATIPLALLSLGGRLAQLKIGSLKIPVAAVFSRLAIGAVIGLAFVYLFNLSGILASIVLLLSVMPPAVNSYVLNEKFSNEADNAATAVLIGTILSVIPIGIILFFH